MNERRRPTNIRQSELVAAALEIIATRGIAALGTRTLAAQVGLSSGAIFKHFASIDALLMAVVDHVSEVLAASLPDPALPPLDRLVAFVERRSQAVGGRAPIQQLMLSDQFLLALPKGGADKLAHQVDETWRFVRQAIEEAQAAGQIRADVPPRAAAIVVMGTTQMLARSQARARLGAGEPGEVLATLMAMLGPTAAPGTPTPHRPPPSPRRKTR